MSLQMTLQRLSLEYFHVDLQPTLQKTPVIVLVKDD